MDDFASRGDPEDVGEDVESSHDCGEGDFGFLPASRSRLSSSLSCGLNLAAHNQMSCNRNRARGFLIGRGFDHPHIFPRA
jgi:hypothetical protein